MMTKTKQLARVAVFSALVFAFCFLSSFVPNVNPAFFVIFAAGFLWGVWPGVTVGAVGYFIWIIANPYGPSPLPLLLSQIVGIGFSGILGALARRFLKDIRWNFSTAVVMAVCGLLSGLVYHVVVDVVDAWLYQPFWPRLLAGLVFSLITIISNAIIFPLFFPALTFLYEKENRV
jgi:uncharacterized membrane protein